MKNSTTWWNDTKNNQENLRDWLQRQYVGEFAAVNLLSEILIRFGHEMNGDQRRNIYKVMLQEALHGQWMSQLLENRGWAPEAQPDVTERYWKNIIPNVKNFQDAMQAAAQAENMRLQRIRAIVNDPTAPADIHKVFEQILPHEEWHEEVFTTMCGDYHNPEIKQGHDQGLSSLSLVLE